MSVSTKELDVVRTLLNADSVVPATSDPIQDALMAAALRLNWSINASAMTIKDHNIQDEASEEKTENDTKARDSGASDLELDWQANLTSLQESLKRIVSRAPDATLPLSPFDQAVRAKVLESMTRSAESKAKRYENLEPPEMKSIRALQIAKLKFGAESTRPKSDTSVSKEADPFERLMNRGIGVLETGTSNEDMAWINFTTNSLPALSPAMDSAIASLGHDGPEFFHLDSSKSGRAFGQTPGPLFEAGCGLLTTRRAVYEEGLSDVHSGKLERSDRIALGTTLPSQLQQLGVLSTALTWLGHHESVIESPSFYEYIQQRKQTQNEARILSCVKTLLEGLEMRDTGAGDGLTVDRESEHAQCGDQDDVKGNENAVATEDSHVAKRHAALLRNCLLAEASIDSVGGQTDDVKE